MLQLKFKQLTFREPGTIVAAVWHSLPLVLGRQQSPTAPPPPGTLMSPCRIGNSLHIAARCVMYICLTNRRATTLSVGFHVSLRLSVNSDSFNPTAPPPQKKNIKLSTRCHCTVCVCVPTVQLPEPGDRFSGTQRQWNPTAAFHFVR
jgi:hypothetical protein